MNERAKPPAKPNYGQYNQVGELPLVGPWIARVGAVIDIYATPGTISPQVWVLAAWHTLPRMLYLFTKPFFVADQYHARLGRSHGGKKSKKKGTAALLAQAIPKFELPPGLGWRVFNVLAAFALKAEWYFFIADRTTEGLFNWVSLAYEYAGIRHPGDDFCSRSNTQGRLIEFADENVRTFAALYGVDDNGTIGSNGTGPYLTAGQVGQFNFTLDIDTDTDPEWTPSAKGISVWVSSSNMSWKLNNTPLQPDANGKIQHNDSITHMGSGFEDVTHYEVQFTGDGFFWLNDFSWTFYGHNTGTRGLLFDP
jgi:hypothetical protein